MDVRIIETVATSGGLNDAGFRVDGSVENISLDWDHANQRLSVVDYNMNYSILPIQLYNEGVKKVFLTYNGKSCDTGQFLETVVMESSDEDDVNQIPCYNNSNEWWYSPAEFTYPDEVRQLTNPADYATKPYDYREGFTVVKQFLTSQANLCLSEQVEYTAFYRAPTLTSFIPANVEANRIYKDGWYTSYACVVRALETVTTTVGTVTTTTLVTPTNSGGTLGVDTGDIFYYAPTKSFYINLTGAIGTLELYNTTSTLVHPDSTNWMINPTFDMWQTLMRNNIGPAMADDPIYFAESQHLVTCDMNMAIRNEVKNICGCCDSTTFGVSRVMNYQKLMQKRLGAWVNFNEGLFHEAACILQNSRKLCYQCLYHGGECLTKPSASC
jgi:hypothetical protein